MSYCALQASRKVPKKQTSWDWFLMTFTRLSLACGEIMGSSVLAAVFRRKPGSSWYCHWQMEQLLTRGLSHNRLARHPKHSKPILGSQYHILLFFLSCVISSEKNIFLLVFILLLYILGLSCCLQKALNPSVQKHLGDIKFSRISNVTFARELLKV